MGNDLTEAQVIALSKNPPKCPRDDDNFYEDFNSSWKNTILDIGLDRGAKYDYINLILIVSLDR
jgi:hypothetical protein